MAGPDRIQLYLCSKYIFVKEPRSVRAFATCFKFPIHYCGPELGGHPDFLQLPLLQQDVFKGLLAATQRTVYHYASLLDNLGIRTSVSSTGLLPLVFLLRTPFESA
jgi:hypothetical protein